MQLNFSFKHFMVLLAHLFYRAGSSVMAAYVEIIFDNSDGELKN